MNKQSHFLATGDDFVRKLTSKEERQAIDQCLVADHLARSIDRVVATLTMARYSIRTWALVRTPSDLNGTSLVCKPWG